MENEGTGVSGLGRGEQRGNCLFGEGHKAGARSQCCAETRFHMVGQRDRGWPHTAHTAVFIKKEMKSEGERDCCGGNLSHSCIYLCINHLQLVIGLYWEHYLRACLPVCPERGASELLGPARLALPLPLVLCASFPPLFQLLSPTSEEVASGRL